MRRLSPLVVIASSCHCEERSDEATRLHCERSEAIWVASSVCFVATLLAMTLDMEN
jgi:hypothetical protein